MLLLFNDIAKGFISKKIENDTELFFSHLVNTVFSFADTSVDGDLSSVNIISA
jgi:hypothetical protein